MNKGRRGHGHEASGPCSMCTVMATHDNLLYVEGAMTDGVVWFFDEVMRCCMVSSPYLFW